MDSSKGLLGEISSVDQEHDGIELSSPSSSSASSSLTVGQMLDHLGLGIFSLMMFVICGLGFLGDAFELLVLSFILPVFVREWQISLVQQAVVTSMGFFGWLVGSLSWGVIADALGRRRTYVLVLASLVGVGMLQMAIVNFPVLLLMRFFMGFAVGGVFTAYALLAEFLPTKHRIVVLSVFQAWFAVGSVFGSLLAIFVLDKGWRLLVGLGIIPSFLALILSPLLPESVRFMASRKGPSQREMIRVCFDRMARWHKVSLEGIELTVEEEGKKESFGKRLKKIFAPRRMAVHTMSLLGLWFCSSFVYYGIVLFSPAYFVQLSSYSPAFFTVLTSLAEIPLLVGGGIASLKYGRRNLIVICFGGTSISLLGMVFVRMIFPGREWAALFASLFARGLSSAAFAVVALLTIESYPTSCRGTGFGFCNGMSRIAGIITPWIAIPFSDNIYFAISIYATFSFAAALLAFVFENKTGTEPLSE